MLNTALQRPHDRPNISYRKQWSSVTAANTGLITINGDHLNEVAFAWMCECGAYKDIELQCKHYANSAVSINKPGTRVENIILRKFFKYTVVFSQLIFFNNPATGG